VFDGDLDVLSASFNDNKIAWYENDGSESFTEHAISASADYASSVYAADMDGDGDMDVLSASAYDDKIAWYENTTASPGTPSFTAATISTASNFPIAVYPKDLDRDGDVDIISSLEDNSGDRILVWFDNNGSQSFTQTTLISSNTNITDNAISSSDLDGDGDIALSVILVLEDIRVVCVKLCEPLLSNQTKILSPLLSSKLEIISTSPSLSRSFG
jgi:hypothetical protein